MSSVIAAEPRASCKNCKGKKFRPKTYDDQFKLTIAVCIVCGDYPDRIRLRRSLPIGYDGESMRVEIRENRLGERLRSVEEAKHIARSIDYDLRDGRFDPNDYRPKSMDVSYWFKNIVPSKYIPACEVKFKVGGFETKKVMINHLVKFFGDYDIRKIRTSDIKEFQLTYKCGARSKDLAIQEMGVILDFFRELNIVTTYFSLPKTKQSRERSADEIISKEEQQIVLKYVYEADDYYGKMIEVLTIYALRPGDLRGLKWNDINLQERSFKIRNHFAKNTLKAGRKSTLDEHVLPITDRFYEILFSIPQSLNGDDFVFRAKTTTGGLSSGPVGEARMRIYWNRAMDKANRRHKTKKVSLYIGTKSATLTGLINDGIDPEELRHLPGLNSIKTLKRYAKESEKNKLTKVRNILNKEREKNLGIG